MKRIFSAVITACLLLVTLSACGGNNDKSNSDKQTAAKTENASAADHFSGETKSTKSSVKNNSGISNQQIVIVPNVVGMNEDEARKKLEELGFKIKTKNSYYQTKSVMQNLNKDLFSETASVNEVDEELPDNLVTLQSLKENSVVAVGSDISILVNKNENYFYLSNDTIVGGRIRPDDKGEVLIPKIYNGVKITKISGSDDYAQRWELCSLKKYDSVVFKIPSDVNVVNELNMSYPAYCKIKFERYN